MATAASDRIAGEQAALRRVATLVARGASPEEVLAAVAGEVGRLLEVDFTVLSRYDPGGVVTVTGLWSGAGAAVPVPDTSARLGGRNVATLVFGTGRPARVDDYARGWGFRSAVGVPVSVEGRLWGVMVVALTREELLPADAEARLAAFTELAATAIANAEAQAALAASRARIVATADATRRRIERDLHDGAQQRLVALALRLRAARAAVPSGAGELLQQLESAAAEADGALEELREIARGILTRRSSLRAGCARR
jgi:signal transduction histidine kinase